jgi:hypothetical protein
VTELKKTIIVAMEGELQAIEHAKAEVQKTLAHLTNLERSLVCETVYVVTEVFQSVACDVHLFTHRPPATDKKLNLNQGDTEAEVFEKGIDEENPPRKW